MKQKRNFLSCIRSENEKDINEAMQWAKKYPEYQCIISTYCKVYEHLVASSEKEHIFYTSVVFGEEIQPLNLVEQIQLFNRKGITNHTFIEVEEIPPEISEIPYFQNLSILKISGSVQTIPSEISKLKKLKELDLSFNEIKCIPSEMGLLSNLTLLNLSNNSALASLPHTVINLKKLELLFICDCSFSEEETLKIKRLLPNCQIKS